MSDLTAEDISLTQTCGACPEQYDAYDPGGKQVGYLRLRHGYFSVEAFDAYDNRAEVYSAAPRGDGIFDPDERDFFLRMAREKIAEHLSGGSGGIQVTATARELLDRHVWDRACDMAGLNPWVLNEGQMDSGERLTFTLEQARELGLV